MAVTLLPDRLTCGVPVPLPPDLLTSDVGVTLPPVVVFDVIGVGMTPGKPVGVLLSVVGVTVVDSDGLSKEKVPFPSKMKINAKRKTQDKFIGGVVHKSGLEELGRLRRDQL